MYNQDKTQWLIWSIEHNAWWAPNEQGYTPYRSMAGKYSTEDASRIVKSANIGELNIPNEAMIIFNP